jgi:hypothetical protein
MNVFQTIATSLVGSGLLTFVVQTISTSNYEALFATIFGGGLLALVIGAGLQVNKHKTIQEHEHRQKKADYEDLLAWCKVLTYEYPQAKRDGRAIWNKAKREGIEVDTYNVDTIAAGLFNTYTSYDVARLAEGTYWYFGKDGNAYLKH